MEFFVYHVGKILFQINLLKIKMYKVFISISLKISCGLVLSTADCGLWISEIIHYIV